MRVLRLAASKLADTIPAHRHDAKVQGVEISLILAEPEAIGGFVGIALSELVLQVGILVSGGNVDLAKLSGFLAG